MIRELTVDPEKDLHTLVLCIKCGHTISVNTDFTLPKQKKVLKI